MPLGGDIPLWGQWGILGLSISINLYFFVRLAIGGLVPHQQVDDEKKTSESWRLAWQVSQETSQNAATLLSQLTVTAKTMEKVLNALPPAQPDSSASAPEEESV